MQADILDLGILDKKLDIVESVGVLHHMSNPMEGWKILVKCLNQGVLMKIELYSSLARQRILKIRNEIDQLGLLSSSDSIRSFRDTVINSDRDHYKKILPTHDFFSLSTLRDLLFHIQEHQFSMHQVESCLEELNLVFAGFEVGDDLLKEFMKDGKKVGKINNLKDWEIFERRNPLAFFGMYQFWCQKTE